MPGFKFKLQSLLNIKQQMEDSLKNQLGKAIQAFEIEKKKLEELYEQKKKCMSEVSNEVSDGTTIEKLRSFNAYISFIKEKIINQSESVKSAHAIVDKYREELLDIVKERKMLEALKEKHFAKFLKEMEINQQKIVDEVISYKESKKNSGGQNGGKRV